MNLEKDIINNIKLCYLIKNYRNICASNNSYPIKKIELNGNMIEVSQDLIDKAKKEFKRLNKIYLNQNKNSLILISMGCKYNNPLNDGIKNHRVRSYFLNNRGAECFVEAIKGQNDNLIISESICDDKKNGESNLEIIVPDLPYTMKNLLNIINRTFKCNFNTIILSKYLGRMDFINI